MQALLPQVPALTAAQLIHKGWEPRNTVIYCFYYYFCHFWLPKVKETLAEKPRDYCLFVLGINPAFRASELLSIRVGQVRYLQAGDRLEIKQWKTKKYLADDAFLS